MPWIKEWPEKEGYYWFYGWTSAPIVYEARKKPTLHMVDILKTGGTEGTFAYIVDGHFVYESDGALGMWLKMDEIILPTFKTYLELKES